MSKVYIGVGHGAVIDQVIHQEKSAVCHGNCFKKQDAHLIDKIGTAKDEKGHHQNAIHCGKAGRPWFLPFFIIVLKIRVLFIDIKIIIRDPGSVVAENSLGCCLYFLCSERREAPCMVMGT